MPVVMHDLVMFDDVSLDLIPANAAAVAAYVDGKFANYAQAKERFPNAHILSIAVSSSDDARCLDVEPGDATNAQAPAWTKRQLAKGGDLKPVLYTSASNIAPLIVALASAGIKRSQYLIWSAHYTFVAHICGPHTCGFAQADGTQWTDHALGRSLDESLMGDAFFPVPDPPKPKPDTGVAHYTVTFFPGRKDNVWQVHGTGGTAHFGGPDKWKAAKLEVNQKTGKARIHRL